MARSKAYIALVNTRRWQKLRAEKLGRSPWCERCLSHGRRKPASEVHHIRPVEAARTAADMEVRCYSYGNLMSLCRECHVTIHTEMGSRSSELKKQRARDEAKRFDDAFYGESDEDSGGPGGTIF